METLFFTETPRYRLIAGARQPVAWHQVTSLGPTSTAVMPAHCAGLKRGFYKQLKVMNLTTFPLGILEKYKVTTIPTQIIVSSQCQDDWLHKVRRDLTLCLRSLALGSEFYMHKPYQKDRPHLLDWRKNAGKKPDHWVIKDFRSESAQYLVVIDAPWTLACSIDREELYEHYLSLIRTAAQAAHDLRLPLTLTFDSELYFGEFDTIRMVLASAPHFKDRAKASQAAWAKGAQPRPATFGMLSSIMLRVTPSSIDGPHLLGGGS